MTITELYSAQMSPSQPFEHKKKHNISYIYETTNKTIEYTESKYGFSSTLF